MLTYRIHICVDTSFHFCGHSHVLLVHIAIYISVISSAGELTQKTKRDNTVSMFVLQFSLRVPKRSTSCFENGHLCT